MILQVPVEGGHEGGRIKVELHDTVRVFNVSEGSDRFCHLTAFYGDCDYHFDEVTFGWRMAMIFDLFLVTPKEPEYNKHLPAPNLQNFLSINNFRMILSEWSELKCPPQLFALLLHHRYSVSELGFHGLKGRDLLIAQFLHSIGTIDVGLSHIFKYEGGISLSNDGNDDDDHECVCCMAKHCACQNRRICDTDIEEVLEDDISIVNWTGSDGRLIDCNGFDIDIDSEVIQFGRSLFSEPESKEIDFTRSGTFDGPFIVQRYQQAVLLFWRKSHTMDLFLNANFTVALEQLEANPNIEDFRKVITFCCQKPHRVWTDANDRENRTCRLLRLCILLKATIEGLKLLDAMAKEFPARVAEDDDPSPPIVDYEGIRTKSIAEGLADLIVLIGWKDTADTVHKLISPLRLMKQMENVAHLATALLKLGCIEGGKAVSSKICAFIFSNIFNVMERSDPPAFIACATMFCHMKEIERIDPSILNSFRILLMSLPLRKLFPTIVGIRNHCVAHEEQHYDCQAFQRELHRHLATCEMLEDLAADVMIFFIQLDDAILLKEFTKQILRQRNYRVIQAIVSSSKVWSMAVPTLGGKWALRLLVNARIDYLHRISIPVFTWIQESKVPLASELDTFLRSTAVVESFFGFRSRKRAEEWAKQHFGPGHVDHGYSAKTTIDASTSNICCIVTKTRDLYRSKLKAYHDSRLELTALCERRLRRLGDDESFGGLFGVQKISSRKRARTGL